MRTGKHHTTPRISDQFILSRFGWILLLSLLPTSLFGQMIARGLGMGWAYTALARGSHAPLWNPANLGLPDNPSFTMTFISVGAGVWNNSFTKSMYDQYLVNGPKDADGDIIWSQRDIEDIINSIPDDGLRMHVGTTVRAFSFSSGRFAISGGADVVSLVRLDKSFIQLPLEGNELNKVYNLNNTDGSGLGIGMMSLSLGQPMEVSFADHFAWGATVHFLYGGVYGKTERADGSFTTKEYGFDVDVNYDVLYSFKGKVGFGLDIGAAAQIGKKWTLSCALANVLGSVPWSEAESEVGYFRGDTLSVLDIAEEDDEEDLLEDSTWTRKNLPGFSARLPVILRCGVAYKEGPVLMTADYVQGFQDGPFISTKPRFSIGTEWRGVSWLPLRMGFVMGGRIGLGSSFGIGIRPGGFVLDIGVMNRGFISSGNSKGFIVAVELGMELHKKEPGVLKVKDF